MKMKCILDKKILILNPWRLIWNSNSSFLFVNPFNFSKHTYVTCRKFLQLFEIKSKDKTLFLSEDLTATIWQKNCTNVDFTNFHLPLDHIILCTNRKWPPFFDWKCGGWKLHLLREIFIMYSIVTISIFLTVSFSCLLVFRLNPLTS